MSFGFMDAIGLVGSVANVLNPQAAAARTQATQPAALTKDDFKSMIAEAIGDFKSPESLSEEEIQEKLGLLFTFMDTNKDGSVSKNEFDQLRALLNNGNLRL